MFRDLKKQIWLMSKSVLENVDVAKIEICLWHTFDTPAALMADEGQGYSAWLGGYAKSVGSIAGSVSSFTKDILEEQRQDVQGERGGLGIGATLGFL